MKSRQTEKKVNAIVDEILDEEQENVSDATPAETCGCEELHTPEETTPRQCRCGVENSSRFSLRVMEAMRSLQRDVDRLSTFTAEEIADYIRSHYRHDGDLNAQVRTALRQVCSQGFVMELLSNEYHLVGPVARSTRRNSCSLDCIGRIADDGVSGYTRRFPRRSPRLQYPKSPREESLKTFIDRPEGPIFHSTGISASERNNADHRAREFKTDTWNIRGDRRDTVGTEQRADHTASVPGPSRNAKRARVEDQGVQRADEDEDEDDETTTEEDCTCDAEDDTRDKYSRTRPPGRPDVIRNGRRRDDVEGEEDEETERIEEDDEEDEDTEDSVYEGLRTRVPRGRDAAHKRDLRRWIRRCRQEYKRRTGR